VYVTKLNYKNDEESGIIKPLGLSNPIIIALNLLVQITEGLEIVTNNVMKDERIVCA